MPSLRVVADNAADRCTIATSSTAGALVAANLLSDDMSKLARSVGTTLTITGTTTVTEMASCISLIKANLSPTATIRGRFYSDTAGLTLVLDTNVLQPGALACPAPARAPRGYTAAQSASAYFNGGGAQARIWFAPVAFRKYVIDIVDTANLQGYIEAARLVVSTYWQAEYGATAAPLRISDSTQLFDNAAGGQMARAGYIRREVEIDLQYMTEADRNIFVGILMNSRSYPILLSAFTGHSSASVERDYLVYGRRPDDSDVSMQYATTYATKVKVVEI